MVNSTHRVRILDQLRVMYAEAAEAILPRIETLVEQFGLTGASAADDLWSERDVVLITYADQIQGEGGSPLTQLGRFLDDYGLTELINTVHLLPFYPWSSDDGFSVIDYRDVDPGSGTWDDVAALQERRQLMFDLVLNHCSAQGEWFQQYLAGAPPYDGYFHDDFDDADLSQVTRPRSTPLLTPFETANGTRNVWTTFSADQVDLDWSNPDVLIEMLDVLLDYVARGARIVRLDAIAFLWKRPGTTCIHLPETHAAVKLMRALLDAVAPQTILLTETNVPHAENVSYFGNSDEARMVYQFSLAPLLLDAFLTGDARPLRSWLTHLEAAAPGTTYFNFTASHDGVGVRPLEGLVDSERFGRLVAAVRERRGHVSTKRNPDGTDSPYELNVTYYSAIAGDDVEDANPGGGQQRAAQQQAAQRFLTSQAVMLALRGIPGIYIHSLLGTSNDHAGVEATGRARSINRRKFTRDELDGVLSESASPQYVVFAGYKRLLATRIAQPAFHPDAGQTVLEIDDPGIIGFERQCTTGTQVIQVLVNVADEPRDVVVPAVMGRELKGDLLSEATTGQPGSGPVTIEPGTVMWLEYR